MGTHTLLKSFILFVAFSHIASAADRTKPIAVLVENRSLFFVQMTLSAMRSCFGSSASSFVGKIASATSAILIRSDRFKVSRVDATSMLTKLPSWATLVFVMAGMVNMQALWYWADVMLIRKTMSKFWNVPTVSSRRTDAAIAGWVKIPLKMPTSCDGINDVILETLRDAGSALFAGKLTFRHWIPFSNRCSGPRCAINTVSGLFSSYPNSRRLLYGYV